MKQRLLSTINTRFMQIVFLANIVAIAFCALVFGLRFEEMSDVFFNDMFKGNFCGNQPLHLFNNYPALFPFSYLFQALYSINNSFPWYGMVMTGLFIALLYCYQYVVYTFSKYYKASLLNTFIYVFIVTGLLIPDIVFVQYTKIAFHLFNAGILLLACSIITRQKSKWPVIYSSVLILLAISVRGMVVPVPLFYFILFFLLFYPAFFKSKKVWLVGSILVLCLAANLQLNTKAYNQADADYAKIENLKELIFDYSVSKTNSIYSNKQDSIKLVAYSNFFISDEANFTNDFYLKITHRDSDDKLAMVLNDIAKDPSYIVVKAQVFWQKLFLLIKAYFFILLAYAIVALYTFVALFRNKEKKAAYKLLLYNTVVFLFLTLFGILVKIEGRLLIPLLTVSFIYTLIIIQKYYGLAFSKTRFNIVILIGLILMLGLNTTQRLFTSLGWGKSETQKEKLYSVLNTNLKDRDIVVWDVFSSNIPYTSLYASGNLPAGKTNISIDCGYYFLTKNYKNYMLEKTGASSFNGYANYIINNKDRVVIISTENKMDLMANYLKLVYNIELKPEKIYPRPAFNAKGVLADYNVFYLFKIR